MEHIISTNNGKNMMTIKKHWYPNKFIFNQNLNNFNLSNDQQENMAILILNRPISLNKDIVIKLWNNALIRILVDGGANRWLTFLDNLTNLTIQNDDTKKNNELTIKLPDFVTGDLDSITEKSMKRLEKMPTTKIIKTTDQNFTDFTKALMELRPHIVNDENKIKSILAIVDSSGRIDHIMANINTMYHAKNIMPADVDLFCICKNSISWLISPGEHIIHIPQKYVEKQLWCSYVPVGSKCTVTTTGFKWNLVNAVVEFGALISTSNTYVDEIVTINCDGMLYWSMGIDVDDDNDDSNDTE